VWSSIWFEVAGFVVAVLPVAVLLLVFRYADSWRPEPKREVVRAVVLGALACVPVFFAEVALKRLLGPWSLAGARFVDAYVVAALPEEAAKLAVVLAVPYRRRYFDEYTDGVLYTGAVSLGFGLFENLLFVSGAFANAVCAVPWISGLCGAERAVHTDAQHVVLGLVRALTTVPMHAIASGLMGYFVGRGRFVRRRHAPRWWAAGLLVAVIVHGSYDWLVFGVGHSPLIFCLLPALLVAAGFGLRAALRHALALDEVMLGPERRNSRGSLVG
jgi:RsiW-degrading membrane proteinase PrsW (M82 family)